MVPDTRSRPPAAATAERNALQETSTRGHEPPAVELPTVLLIAATYGGWLAVTYAYGRWPLWIVAPVTAVLLALHSSVQHEILHGHPTRWRPLNRVFGMVPLSFWLPYERYRRTHLDHHVNERLTDPYDDPETYYWTHADWARLDPLSRGLVRLQLTLAGRFIIGSFWRIGRFLRAELRAVIRNDDGLRVVWFEHLLWCVPVIAWVTLVCGMPLWVYVVAMVIPGNGILMIRSFAEHRALPEALKRTAIVERSWILGPLFLFNNLHAMHHEAPLIPWYDYNARYRIHRDRLIADNGGLVYASYFEVARRYLLNPHDSPQHPTDRVPAARAI